MKSKAGQSQGILLFKLTPTQSFAIGTLKIREIVPYTPLTVLPKSHRFVLGAASVRGLTIPVIDMAAAVGYKPLTKEEIPNCFIIITDCQRKTIGFLVRQIERISECSWKDIEAPAKNLGRKAFLTGVTRIDGKVIQLLDVELVISLVFPNTEAANFHSLTDVQREKLKPLNILLVDDSLVARAQLSDALDRMNISYQVTANGNDALNIMKQNASENSAIDLVVSDIEMPGLDGYELTFEIRNNSSQLGTPYIILHTSLSSEISVSQAHQVGANEALTKFDAGELVQAMLRGAEYKSANV
ncbi:chemotaxis protein [Alkalimarinus alittae]|uniref:Chemotaxis protein n=1 Tax=Alkalimarinus alittae TaxID=2961619 RepID=A0ABY6N7Q2_9ALTE|nr:chemotaxis protein [Alkalimarinus alittae]UZE98029.1 chemotaxis protein [Alkalimarinus alittae]